MPTEYSDFVEFIKELCYASKTVFRCKHIRHIFVNVKLIDAGLKPGYLWDRAPFFDALTLRRFVDQLKLKKITKTTLSVVEVNSELFIINKCALKHVLSGTAYFMSFNVGFKAFQSSNEDFSRMIIELSATIDKLDLHLNQSITPLNNWSVPGLYGVLLGYPVVMWLPTGTEHVLNAESIVNVKVNVSYKDVDEFVELYSFSYRPLDAMDEHVNRWFQELKRSQIRNCTMSMDKAIVTACSITL